MKVILLIWALPCRPRCPLYLLFHCVPQKDAASIANAEDHFVERSKNQDRCAEVKK